MRLKRFRAAGIADAMAQVRAELGSDALILSTRRVYNGVEITAALDSEPELSKARCALLAALAWHGVPPELRPALAHDDLETAISSALRFRLLPLVPNGRPVVLTGPPGAGKTLATVRLATRLVTSGNAPMVITTDTRRAGATEQLAAFTRLLSLPLFVVNHPMNVARALKQRRDGAPVLIDTTGVDPREPVQAEELMHLAKAADAHIALVLPAGLDTAEAAELAVAYAKCGATSLIATRLDVSHRLGGVVAAAAASGLSLAEAGVGAGAADGLVPFTPSLLAMRLRHSTR
jgi:flagellar biosynthesis protein FlhF